MTSLLGSVGAFQEGQEDWTCYCERLEQFFQANGIDDEGKRRAVLLSVCGGSVYQLIRNLVAPGKPADKSFSELVTLVRTHFRPSPSVTVQRYNFNSRSQRDGESVSQFVAELRRLSEHCDFGNTLEDMLRDRLVCGIRDIRVQRRLLAEPGLTFTKAFGLAQSAELAEKNVQDLQQSEGSPVHPVHKVEPAGKPWSGNCSRCGGKHKASDCRCKSLDCYKCGKRGHLARVCRSQGGGGSKGTRSDELSDERSGKKPLDTEKTETYALYNLSSSKSRMPLVQLLTVNGTPLQMQVDTGAVVSLISESTYMRVWPQVRRPALEKSGILLRTYTGEGINVVGKICVDVQHEGQNHRSLDLLVVQGRGPSLIGRDWLSKLKINLSLFYVGSSEGVEQLLERHATLFEGKLGLLEGMRVKIHVDKTVKPRFYKPRPVPYALRDKVEQELERLQRDGVIEPVRFSEWAAPVVPVVKSDGSLRICGDYKLTVNSAATVDSYPLPRIDDVLASMTGAKVFSKLDLSHAYLQLQLEEESKEFVTISTHKGLFRYNRLPFGIAAAPAIFQRTMEGILQDIPHVQVYIDDILVADSSREEHMKTLAKVLSRLQQVGAKLKKEKCQFMMPSVEYLGFHISGEGIRPTQEKRQAIVNAPAPGDATQLKSFIGLVNYYSKFLPSLADTLAPLYKLLGKHQRWHWGKEQADAFQKAKSQLSSDVLLVHFDPGRKLAISCDASPYGIGAVLSHVYEDGTDRPIAYASRSLAPAEKNYSQIEKEGLAVVWGVKKFHLFLYGREFIILSDHKPLQFLFNEQKPIPTMASGRIQRWALTLSAYKYHMEYRAGKDQGNVDALSRLPVGEAPSEVPIPGDTVLMLQMLSGGDSIVTASAIRKWTNTDPLLSMVRRMVLQGWESQLDAEFKPYLQRRYELSVQNGCVLWGCRVVVPPPGRAPILKLLHEGHPGISRMKALARSVVWWPGLDAELEVEVKSCTACQDTRNTPSKSLLHPWEWPSKPWARLHVDFFGPFLGKTFFVIVDSHSKWVEAAVVSSPSSQQAMRILRHTFATHGLPDILVSDNGAAFTSAEFQLFVKANGFRHVRSTPYHAATNGLAERAVQSLKNALKRMTGDVETGLARFLFQYRLTPHSTTGQSPAELLLGRKPKSHLDFVFPSLKNQVQQQQERQKDDHDRKASHRSFVVGERVYCLNHRGGLPKWLSGVIRSVQGPVTVVVKLEDGKESRYHIDHVRSRSHDSTEDGNETMTSQEQDAEEVGPLDPNMPPVPEQQQPPPPPMAVTPEPQRRVDPDYRPVPDPVPAPIPRRSTRPHHPPERFGW